MNRPAGPPAYRAFRVDASGRIYRSHVLDCETDEQAIAAAREFVDAHGVQLWDGSRKLMDFPPVPVTLKADLPNADEPADGIAHLP